MSDVCWNCKIGAHEACSALFVDDTCVCDHTSKPIQALSEIGAALQEEHDSPAVGSLENTHAENINKTRKWKNESAVTDQQSTGRKRAAVLFPLKNEDGSPKPCEYAGRNSVLPNFVEFNMDGCGVRQGTATGIAQSRHHLNYDTLDNSGENVVRICHSCHNKLHALNDPHKDKIYERIYGFKPSLENLSHAAKQLRSGVVAGGHIRETTTNEDAT